jgi:hypothetical protein
MLDRGKKLFCHRMKLENGLLVRDGDSDRYTLITLLGLNKVRLARGTDPFAVDSLLSSRIEKSNSIDCAGDAGLLLWLTAAAQPDRMADVLDMLGPGTLLNRYADGRTRKTTELSWLLTGLSYAKMSAHKPLAFAEQLARDTWRHIRANYSGVGIFRHEGDNSLAGKIRGHIGAFSDQVYPIYALSAYSKAFGDEEAAQIAKACADRICRLQGDMGQWWWYYDANTGGVAGYYPVYSVHQDGMAPMALYAAQENAKTDYGRYIEKGLAWLYGQNELKHNMVSRELSMIWRSIGMGERKRDVDLIKAVIGLKPSVDEKKLSVLFECRPYHLGWLLYAFADKAAIKSTFSPLALEDPQTPSFRKGRQGRI